MLKLWPHQLQTCDFARDHDLIFDTSSAGTGKTPAHATIIASRLAAGGSRAVVFCPKTLMRSAWLEDLQRFTPHLTVSVAEAPTSNRDAAFGEKTDVVLINTDAFQWFATKTKRWLTQTLGKHPMLVVDESSWLKNPAARRTKAAMAVSQMFDQVTLLSGTPAPNSVVELWSQIKILDGGERLGNRYTKFRSLFQYPVPKGPFTNWVDRDDARDVVASLISDITIGHKFDDVMTQVPPMEHRVLYYDLPTKHMATYKELEENAFLQLKDKNVTAINAGVLAGKLLQCASGAVYADSVGEEKHWAMLDAGRYELIADLIEAREATVVFHRWHHQKLELAKILKHRGLSFGVLDSSVASSTVRDETVKKFQDGQLRALLLHNKTGSFGLTLSRSVTVIFSSPLYEADTYAQASARVRRGIQRRPTESIVILARDTKDEHAYSVFAGKKTRMDAINELLQVGVN